MDKSAFFKFSPEEEKEQGIGYLLLEMFKIRRQINVLNMQPEIASKINEQTRVSAWSIIICAASRPLLRAINVNNPMKFFQSCKSGRCVGQSR